jgi:hypothetical protein
MNDWRGTREMGWGDSGLNLLLPQNLICLAGSSPV